MILNNLKQFQKINQFNYFKTMQYNTYMYFSVDKLPPNLTYYELLEVKRMCKTKDIKVAYFKKVKTCHPDLFQGDKIAEENFKRIVEAYETLKDPAKRQIYDLGQQNPHFQDGASSESYQRFYDQEDLAKNHQENKYYENKWYNYEPLKDKHNLRDEYYKEGERWEAEEVTAWKKILKKFAIIAGIWLCIDLYRFYRKQQHSNFINTQRKIIDQAKNPNQKEIQINEDIQIPINNYIDIRSQQIEDQESGQLIRKLKI